MVKRRYADRGKITRTITATTFDLSYFDRETREIKTAHFTLTGRLAEKEMLSSAPDGCVGLEVTNVQCTETLYVCDIEDFIKVAKPIADNETVDEN